MPNPLRTLFADLTSVAASAIGPSSPDPDRISFEIPITAPLVNYADTPRFFEIDRLESYYRKRQHDRRRYTWNGGFAGYNGEGETPVAYYVPYSQRRPSACANLAVKITDSFTDLLFGEEHQPTVLVPGDEDSTAFLKAIIEASTFWGKMAEGRSLGGCGRTAVYSAAFVDGRPEIEVHNPKHVTVLSWADEERRIPARVLKAYKYPREVFDNETKRVVNVWFYYVRYIDEQRDVTFEPIDEKLAKLPDWAARAKRREEVVHGWPRCPVYWVQNMFDSAHPDGHGDYEGLEGNLDELDELLSAAQAGTKANVDPTLVIHMDEKQVDPNKPIRKGSGNAIFSPAGAEYLELKGQAAAAAIAQYDKLKRETLEAAHCVIPDPEKVTGAAQSGRALQMLYAPMTSRANAYRTQYGNNAVIPILQDFLRAAAKLQGPFDLPLREVRVETEEPEAPKMGERVVENPPERPETELVPQKLGTSDRVQLKWPPYFPAGWPDIAQAVTAAQTASGGKPIVSQRTAVRAVAQLFGVTDIEEELHEMQMDSEKAMDADARKLAMMPAPDEEGGPPLPKETK